MSDGAQSGKRNASREPLQTRENLRFGTFLADECPRWAMMVGA
jgi:hypothetical protein